MSKGDSRAFLPHDMKRPETKPGASNGQNHKHDVEVVVANRILAREEQVDAYGHVSIRNPENSNDTHEPVPQPELVTLGDGGIHVDWEAIGDDRTPYAERHIHGAIHEARPEVNAVVHNHSHAVIPFGVTPVPLKPVAHVGASIGKELPVWDIRRNFGDTNLLVVNMEQAGSPKGLATTMSSNARTRLCVTEPRCRAR